MTPIGQVIKVALPKLLLLKSESEIILLKQDISDFNVTINSKFVFDLLKIKKVFIQRFDWKIRKIKN